MTWIIAGLLVWFIVRTWSIEEQVNRHLSMIAAIDEDLERVEGRVIELESTVENLEHSLPRERRYYRDR